MTAYTRGELQGIMWREELTYGLTPTGALAWGGKLVSVKPRFDVKKEFIPGPGSRGHTDVVREFITCGANIKYYARIDGGGYDWRYFGAAMGYGTISGVVEHLSSFSMQLAMKVGSSYRYNKYSGCKFDKLAIQSDGAGLPLLFDADIICQYIEPSTSKSYTKIQAVTMGADAAEVTAPILKYTGNVQIDLGSGPYNLKPKTWKFTVQNGLEAQEGNLPGASGGPYSLAAGSGINEGERQILFEFSKDCEGEDYINAVLSDTAVAAVTIPVGANTITLSDLELIGDLPERQHAIFQESYQLRATSMAIA